jgi:hypothetical protein
MKRLLTVVLACLILMTLHIPLVFADDLVCDPQAAVTDYRVTGLDPARVEVAAETDGSIKYDVGSLTVGTYNGTIEAGRAYVLDGIPQEPVKWSPVVPFVLSVPSVPVSSSGHAVKK